MGIRAGAKADLYDQLAALQAAGMPPLRTLETLRDRPPSREMGRMLGRWAAKVREGQTFSAALPLGTGGFEPFESAVIAAGEESGRLDALFRELGRYWRRMAETRRRVMAGLIYPLVLLHAAIIAGNVPAGVTGGAAAFAFPTLTALALLYALLWFGWELAGLPAFAAILERLPLAGRTLVSWRLFRFALCLRLQVEAGVRILTAVPRALAAAGGPALAARGEAAVRRLSAGEPLGDVLAPILGAPEGLRSMLATGVESGRLNETLKILETEASAAWEESVALLQTWLPRLIYFAAIAFAAWQIVRLAGSMTGAYKDAATMEW